MHCGHRTQAHTHALTHIHTPQKPPRDWRWRIHSIQSAHPGRTLRLLALKETLISWGTRARAASGFASEINSSLLHPHAKASGSTLLSDSAAPAPRLAPSRPSRDTRHTGVATEPCMRYLPRLYLDIHNYCVLARLRDFAASPQCRKVAQVDALKDKVRKLYIIMNSFCRRDLVFLSDDCNALEYPVPSTVVLPDGQN